MANILNKTEKTETYTIKGVVLNDALIERIGNLFSEIDITAAREEIAETVMSFATIDENNRPCNDFNFYVNKFYEILKLMEPLNEANALQREKNSEHLLK
jgi:hypothetical protein